ncbi:MAG: thioredoxin family protein [Granulosicoccus sp.]|nr:thioredoxin family protein [Granulosicoccus sp.]
MNLNFNFVLARFLRPLCIGLCVMGLSISTQAEQLAASADDFFEVSFGDLQEELELSKEEGKKGLVVMFETQDCPWCLRMKQQVLNRVRVQEYYSEHFRALSMNAEGDVSVVDFDGSETTAKEFSLRAMRVRATPVFAFFDNSGALLTRYTGALKNAHDFLLLGRFVADGHYKDQKFNRFRRENQPL